MTDSPVPAVPAPLSAVRLRAWLGSPKGQTLTKVAREAEGALNLVETAVRENRLSESSDVLLVRCWRAGKPSRLAFIDPSDRRVQIITVISAEEEQPDTLASRRKTFALILPGVTLATFTPLYEGAPLRRDDWQALTPQEPDWIKGAGCGLSLLFPLASIVAFIHYSGSWWELLATMVMVFPVAAQINSGLLWIWRCDRRRRAWVQPQKHPGVRLHQWASNPPEGALKGQEHPDPLSRRWVAGDMPRADARST